MTVAAIPSVCDIVANHVPEAIYLPLPDMDGTELILAEKDRFDAGLFGPGATTESDTLDLFKAIWAEWDKPAVIDADGLNAIAKGITAPKGPLAMTPHPGEASRLLGWSAKEITNKRFEAAKALSEKWQSSVLLKGAHTLIASNGSPTLVNTKGNPGMAGGRHGRCSFGSRGHLACPRSGHPNGAGLRGLLAWPSRRPLRPRHWIQLDSQQAIWQPIYPVRGLQSFRSTVASNDA